MELKRDQKKQRPIPASGTHVALCYSIIDLGTHSESYLGAPPKATRSIQIAWELANQTAIFDPAKGPQPLAVFEKYTASIGDLSKLGKVLKSWRNVSKLDSANLHDYLGKACIINIVHNEDKKVILPVTESLKGDGKLLYAKVDSVMPLMQGMPVPQPVNPQVYFSLDKFTWESFNAVPEWIQKKIKESAEWNSVISAAGENPAPAPVAGQQQAQYATPAVLPIPADAVPQSAPVQGMPGVPNF